MYGFPINNYEFYYYQDIACKYQELSALALGADAEEGASSPALDADGVVHDFDELLFLFFEDTMCCCSFPFFFSPLIPCISACFLGSPSFPNFSLAICQL